MGVLTTKVVRQLPIKCLKRKTWPIHTNIIHLMLHQLPQQDGKLHHNTNELNSFQHCSPIPSSTEEKSHHSHHHHPNHLPTVVLFLFLLLSHPILHLSVKQSRQIKMKSLKSHHHLISHRNQVKIDYCACLHVP